jgi:hypothetical protein
VGGSGTARGRAQRVLAIMGSGETSPTMVSVHKALAAMLPGSSPSAVLLDTPYAFQENAGEVTAKARAYFARSVGLTVTAADRGSEAAAIRSADWLFAGPGSPSYALRRWQSGGTASALRERVGGGRGITVIASAAAATAGLLAVPVYEIYKVGADPFWLDGLDLTGMIGLKVAVIPHFNNAEGGTHDTRFCYLGERRLAAMERELPADAAVLGVDEHTAAIIDLLAETLTVAGRGGVTVRRPGSLTVLPAGTVVTLDRLRAMVAGQASEVARDDAAAGAAARVTDAPRDGSGSAAAALPLPELTRECERRFEAAERARDARGMAAVILDLEDAIHAWAADTDEDQGTEQSRAVLRALVARLGAAAGDGLHDPASSLRPVVGPLLELREALRGAGRYADADAIRAALAGAGLSVRDTPAGPQWEPAAS